MNALVAVRDFSSEPGKDRLLDMQEKAAELHVSVSHLRRLVEAGKVEAIDLTLPGSLRRVLRFRRNA